MSRVILVDPKQCTGCRICELVCSLSHTGVSNPERSSVRVILQEHHGMLYSFPVLCFQCETPVCQRICPTGAIFIDSETGARLTDSGKCIGCSACVYICPFGASAIDPVTQKAFRCNLCEGQPRCVSMCPGDALAYVYKDEVSVKVKRRSLRKIQDYIESDKG